MNTQTQGDINKLENKSIDLGERNRPLPKSTTTLSKYFEKENFNINDDNIE